MGRILNSFGLRWRFSDHWFRLLVDVHADTDALFALSESDGAGGTQSTQHKEWRIFDHRGVLRFAPVVPRSIEVIGAVSISAGHLDPIPGSGRRDFHARR